VSRPAISVLVPCRDAAATLRAAAASLMAQRHGDFEVLAVDDASTDDTPRILRQWARRDRRVRLLATAPPDTGLVAALRLALAHARGTFIARMDADDLAHPDRFGAQLAFLQAHPAVAACGSRVRYFPAEAVRDGARRYARWLNRLSTPAAVARDIFVECPIAHPALMARSDALRTVGGYHDPGWPEDYDLVLRLWSAGHDLANVPALLLRWRESARRASRSDPRYDAAAFRRCKVHYLRRTLLAARDGAVVWGAGPTGKAFARELLRQDVPLRAFVDLDPRKVGQTIHGAPVIPPGAVDGYRDALVLAAVGSDQGRAEIRAVLRAGRWRELVDFCAVA
jgi:glycosyltransferase involved in cell wall biosynthesis